MNRTDPDGYESIGEALTVVQSFASFAFVPILAAAVPGTATLPTTRFASKASTVGLVQRVLAVEVSRDKQASLQ